jgi:hypothetical protein
MKWSIVLVAALVSSSALAQQTRFYDASGRSIGTATTNQATTTFRDSSGRTTGTATTTPGSGTVYRDAGGRTVGRSTR